MWEITAGRRPFSSTESDVRVAYNVIDGKRPKITDDTPKCFINLMKKCWRTDPKKRPSITEVRKTISLWYNKEECVDQFIQAEKKRNELIKLKKIGPITEKSRSNKIVVIGISRSPSASPSSKSSNKGIYYR